MTSANPKKKPDVPNGRRDNVLFFSAGGMHFGVEASSITNITDRDWTPPEGSRKFELGNLLGLASSRGARTLVVKFSHIFCGFVVDSIFSQGIANYSINPASPLLREWMKLPLVTGFCTNNNRLIGILDLRGLAEHALALQDHRTSKT